MKYTIIFLTIFGLASCQSGGSDSGSLNLDNFTIEKASGSTASKASKSTVDGTLVEEGYFTNGAKNGVWMLYHSENGRIKTLESYTDNQLNGPLLEFNNRGQIEKESYYLGGKLHGTLTSYKFGRAIVATTYANGEIDGTHKEFNNKGDLQKYVEFKNGKQHGKLRYYDDEGKVTLEYEYKNGEKVSGGMPVEN